MLKKIIYGFAFIIITIITCISIEAKIKSQQIIIHDTDINTETPEVIIEEVEPLYYGLTYDDLIIQIDKSLNSTVSGYGEIFVNKSLELGVDPYLATAIMLHETGCKWNCSKLVKSCNNVGGMKGGPSCGSGSYKRFDTLEQGIEAYINNLYNNYISKGLNTPELMQRKYTGSTSSSWAVKVNNYIEEIKSK